MQRREVLEGTQYQGVDEIISYTLDVTAIGSSPATVSAVVKDVSAGTTVTATVMPTNSPSVVGNVITLSPLKLLTAEHVYRVEVKYTISGNVIESYFKVQAEE